MNLSFFKKLLPGLLPLFLFILVDEIWGTKAGLYVALAFGLAELLFYYIRDKKIDGFIILDTGLLLVMGVVSIALDNDIFFKIKPALIEFILLVIIALSLWGPKNIIMSMSQRYLGDMHLDEGQEKAMKMNMIAMFWITFVHILLVLYSAKYMSAAAWGFISGGLFYIFFAFYFAVLWIIKIARDKRFGKEEWFPVVDEDGKLIGKAPRSVCHDGKSKLLHPVVHLHLFDKTGRLFLQKRALNKDIQPGKWDTSVGGHVDPGETIEEALRREVREEIDLVNFEPQFIEKYVWESARERELVFSFITVSDFLPVINRSEISDGRFWTINEIMQNRGKEIFTTNFEKEFVILMDKLSDK